jgi:signal peptidase I
MRRSLRTVTRVTAGLLAGSVVLLVAAYAGLIVAGYRPVAVYSGSMVPSLRVGSLAVDRPIDAQKVRVGDVITFSDPYVDGRLVTHRVVAIISTKQGPAYRTKGDANPDRDPWTIRLTGEVGRVSFSIPFAGYALVYAHTREVRGALILIAAAFVLIGLLRRIWRKDSTAPAGA